MLLVFKQEKAREWVQVAELLLICTKTVADIQIAIKVDL